MNSDVPCAKTAAASTNTTTGIVGDPNQEGYRGQRDTRYRLDASGELTSATYLTAGGAPD
ncbi:hypothetical protein GCM10023321_18510 [Pseudonocardia eucalypti]|uniref:Uncharacterized protein n=1 Tax=Pseudonocardia eucalypti TaxID=648755 RepID=A0ABP9PV00_9PSEU